MMKRLLHLAWHDARAMRGPLALWLLVLLAEAVQAYWGPTDSVPATELGRAVSSAGFGILRIAFACIFTAMLVHRDPVIGTTPFWKAKPISGALLLGSKALSAALWFIALPAAVVTALLTLLGVAPGDAVRGGLYVAGTQSVAVIVAMGGAAVTATLLHFVMAALGAIALTSLGSSVIGPWIQTAWPTWRIPVPSEWRSLVTAAGLALTAATVAYQYVTRNLRRTIAALAVLALAGSVATSLVQITYDSSYFRGPLPSAEHLIPSSALSITIDTATQKVEGTSILDKVRGARISFLYSAENLDPEMDASAVFVESDVQYPDGSRSSWSSDAPFARTMERVRSTGRTQPFKALAHALDVKSVGDVAQEIWASRLCLAVVPAEKFTQFAGQAVRVTGTVRSRLMRYGVVGTMPLREGSTIQVPGGSERIERIEYAGRSPLFVTVRQIIVGSWAFDERFIFPVAAWRNPARREAVRVGIDHRRQTSDFLLVTNGYVGSERYREILGAERRPGEWVPFDDQWLAGAERVVLAYEYLGFVTRPFVIDRVVLGEAGK